MRLGGRILLLGGGAAAPPLLTCRRPLRRSCAVLLSAAFTAAITAAATRRGHPSPPPPPPPPPPHDWRRTRINGAVLLAMLAFFLHRVSSVGLVEAVAEAVGLSDTYAYWSTAYWPLQPELFRSQPPSYWLDPSLATAIALPNATHRTNALMDLVQDHGNGIYSLWLLR